LPSAPRTLLTQLQDAPQLAQVEQQLKISNTQQQQLQKQLRQMRWLVTTLIVAAGIAGAAYCWWLFFR
jgi:hypothetical protein